MAHSWRFFRAGGLEQVRIETGADIAHIGELDQKLWVALACPVRGLEFDEKTLALIDTDKDGRVRPPEVIEAVKFCTDALKNLDGLVAGTDAIPLASIDGEKPGGKAILASAKRILDALGKPASPVITLADAVDTTTIFAKTRFNGDGIVTPASTDDAALGQVITDAIATVGGEPDRSGGVGIAQAKLDLFFEQLAAYDAWSKLSEADPAIRPFGDATAAAAAALTAVKPKIDDWFTRAKLAAYDTRAQAALNHVEGEYTAIGAKDLSAAATEVAGFPVAGASPGALPLTTGINPAWTAAIAALVADVLTPHLGTAPATLTAADWASAQARLAPHLAWAAAKPASTSDKLGLERVRAILASDAKARLAELTAHDKSFEAEFAGMVAVEKLCRYHRDLFRLLHNLTSFTDFYAPDRLAVFQAGTLYLDSRSCELCVRVDDAGKHAAMAGLAKCYLAYCDCTRPGEKMTIAAVFSQGDSDYLMVGRNGVFYDRKGRDWDATITKVIENPISLREAFFAPYKRFVRFVEEQVAKRAAAADAESTTQLQAVATTPGAPPRPPGGFDLSTIALIGVAVSGAAAVIGGILQAFLGLGIWMPLGFAGIILLISGPSMLIAALKLRQRNLGPVLDANGWAINGRVRVNIPFGSSLTLLPTLPPGAQSSRVDPYQPKGSIWSPILYAVGMLVLTAVSVLLAYHNGWLPAVVEQRVAFLGVPLHLKSEKEHAQAAFDEAKAVLTSAQEQQAVAKKTYDDLITAGAPADVKLERAKARLDRADARLARAEDKLETRDGRLEQATEALEAAIDANEARIEAQEAAAP
jgi:hypothetical protein